MGSLLRDLKFSVRSLLKHPGFTAVVVLTLALGIGANTTIFSTVDALILHPFSFPNQDRLVVVWEQNRAVGNCARDQWRRETSSSGATRIRSANNW